MWSWCVDFRDIFFTSWDTYFSKRDFVQTIKLHLIGYFRPRAGSAEKGFSRQNIQNKIDSVRQKWGFTGGAGDGEGVTGAPAATGKTPRPKSYAGEGDDGEWRLKNMMAYLHFRTRTWKPTRIRTSNQMATLYCLESAPIAHSQTQIRIRILIPDHYCTQFWDRYLYRIGIWISVWQCNQVILCAFKISTLGNVKKRKNHCTLLNKHYSLFKCDDHLPPLVFKNYKKSQRRYLESSNSLTTAKISR